MCYIVTGKEIKNLTVKFLNFRMQENFAVIYLKFRPNLRGFHQKHANGIANSEDPD